MGRKESTATTAPSRHQFWYYCPWSVIFTLTYRSWQTCQLVAPLAEIWAPSKMFNSKSPFIFILISIELNQARLVIYLKNAWMVHLFISNSRSVSILPIKVFPWLLKLLNLSVFIGYFVETFWRFRISTYIYNQNAI